MSGYHVHVIGTYDKTRVVVLCSDHLIHDGGPPSAKELHRILQGCDGFEYLQFHEVDVIPENPWLVPYPDFDDDEDDAEDD